MPLKTHGKQLCRLTAQDAVQHPGLHPAPHHNTRCYQCVGKHSLEHTGSPVLDDLLRATQQVYKHGGAGLRWAPAALGASRQAQLQRR